MSLQNYADDMRCTLLSCPPSQYIHTTPQSCSQFMLKSACEERTEHRIHYICI